MAGREFYNKVSELGIILKHSGKQLCPKCSASRTNKNDKCLSVTYEKDALLYCCHHCGWTGAISYYEKRGQKHYNRPDGFKNRENINPLINYFKKRGISEETIKKYNIGYDEEGYIIFPYYKDEILVNIKKRKNLGNGKRLLYKQRILKKHFLEWTL